MLCQCYAGPAPVRASYPAGQGSLPQRPLGAPGSSGVLDPAAPQPLGAGVPVTRPASVPIPAARPLVKPDQPSLWGAAALRACAATPSPWPRTRWQLMSGARQW